MGRARAARGRKRLVVWLFETNGTKKDVIFKNEPERLLKTKDRAAKTNRNEPKNEAEKSFRIVPVEKTNLKTNLTMLLKINDGEKMNRSAHRENILKSSLFRRAQNRVAFHLFSGLQAAE
jgi:hypothetical protein